MKQVLSICMAASLCVAASAQDLDTESFVDQLNSGSRGNNVGSGTWGASAPDGTEYEDYSGPDLSGSAAFVRYINTWGSDGSVESPVMDVTVPQLNPDRNVPMNVLPIPPNNRPGATDGSTAIFLGDDGGHNGLYFGENDDADYYVEVDMYAPVFTPSNAMLYEHRGVAVRAGRDNVEGEPHPTVDHSYTLDRAGSYAIMYDTYLRKFAAGKWTHGNTVASIDTRAEGVFTEYGSRIIEDSGWYTARIVANGETIDFYLNGELIGTVTEGGEAAYSYGRAGLIYRDGGASGTDVDPEDETQGIFDHLRAGPSSEANVRDWSMY